jgi:hypothetical protein
MSLPCFFVKNFFNSAGRKQPKHGTSERLYVNDFKNEERVQCHVTLNKLKNVLRAKRLASIHNCIPEPSYDEISDRN